MIKNHTFSRLRVLAYHKVKDINLFETQLRFINSKYTVIGLEELENYIIYGGKLPPKALLITFDDGDLSVYKNAFPVLKKYKLPAILFVITDLIDTQNAFWWDEFEYCLGREEGNKKAWEVKTWGNSKREAFLEELRNTSSKPLLKYKQLTTAQLKEMQKAGIMIANHSHTHPMFDQCSEEEINYELSSSKKMFLDWKIGEYHVFAYPNGNYDKVSERILSKRGVKIAFLFDHKINQPVINPLRVSRIRVSADTGLTEFEAKVSGIYPFIYSIFK